jgi:hypothetical protein
MKLSLTTDNTSNRRFTLLAPAGVSPRGVFRHVEGDSTCRQQLLADMQRMRGRIYLEDGAISPGELTADGRHVQAIDDQSWHLLLLSNRGRVLGCTRYLQHHASTPYNRLRVRTAALADSNRWSEPLRRAVESELQSARQNGFSFVEVGGWALDASVRNSADAVRSVLFTYAWSQVIGGCVGVSMATQRNGSASILRRIGGRPLSWDGAELPPYYDPHYKCEMELLRFDSRVPNAKYQPVIDEIRSQVPFVPVICAHKPVDAWHTLVNRLRPVSNMSSNWSAGVVAPAA